MLLKMSLPFYPNDSAAKDPKVWKASQIRNGIVWMPLKEGKKNASLKVGCLDKSFKKRAIPRGKIFVFAKS